MKVYAILSQYMYTHYFVFSVCQYIVQLVLSFYSVASFFFAYNYVSIVNCFSTLLWSREINFFTMQWNYNIIETEFIYMQWCYLNFICNLRTWQSIIYVMTITKAFQLHAFICFQVFQLYHPDQQTMQKKLRFWWLLTHIFHSSHAVFHSTVPIQSTNL